MKCRSSAILAFICATAACSAFPTIQTVASSELLANPEAYAGKRVKVVGLVSYGFENCAIDGAIWYWPRYKSCYDLSSMQNAWEGHGAVIGTVSLTNHGHLGVFRFSLVNATVEHL